MFIYYSHFWIATVLLSMVNNSATQSPIEIATTYDDPPRSSAFPSVAPKLVPLPQNLEMEVGERFQLACATLEGTRPITFSWMKDGRRLPGSTEVVELRLDDFSSAITVHALKQSSAGDYTCIAFNQAGNDSSTLTLKVPLKRELPKRVPVLLSMVNNAATQSPIEISTTYDDPPRSSAFSSVPPKLAPLPRNFEMEVGEPFHLKCWTLEGTRPITFSWMKDGRPLPGGTEVVEQRFDDFSSAITAHALTQSSAGDYTCIASNQAGNDSLIVTLKVPLKREPPKIVPVPPSWIWRPDNTWVLSGTPVTLYCQTTGWPTPTVTWRRSRGFDSQQMEPLSTTHWLATDNGRLSTSEITKEDEGFYSCEVTNGVGEGLTKTVRVRVQVPPSVTVTESEETVYKGDSTTLRCNVAGDVPFTTTWRKASSNLPLISDDRIQIYVEKPSENTSIVIITKTITEDTGLYICTAKNDYGESEDTVSLQVIEFAPISTYVSRDGNGKICFLARFGAFFEITYESESGNKTVTIDIPGDAGRLRGRCPSFHRDYSLDIVWPGFRFVMDFTPYNSKEKQGYWEVLSIELLYNTGSPDFVDASNEGKKISRTLDGLFLTPFGKSFCSSSPYVVSMYNSKRERTVLATLKDVRFQAYDVQNDTFSECSSGSGVIFQVSTLYGFVIIFGILYMFA